MPATIWSRADSPNDQIRAWNKWNLSFRCTVALPSNRYADIILPSMDWMWEEKYHSEPIRWIRVRKLLSRRSGAARRGETVALGLRQIG
jgi:hypothetical protein